MTTRKHLALAATLLWTAFGEAGCATPGPLHVYTVAATQSSSIADHGEAIAVEVSDFLAASETLTGFAYDPFTDHLFLRLAPGNRFRVVDRPAHAVKREFTAEDVPTTGGGDLAVRPRDGHVFLVQAGESVVIELTRFGKFVRTIALAAAGPPLDGIAYDTVRDQMLVLNGGATARVTSHDLDGRFVAEVWLTEPVSLGSLGFDSEKREFYVPLPGGHTVGVFAESGKLVRTIPVPAVFVDVGPRSFLRLF